MFSSVLVQSRASSAMIIVVRVFTSAGEYVVLNETFLALDGSEHIPWNLKERKIKHVSHMSRA